VTGIVGDAELQPSAGPLISVTAGLNFDGVGNGFAGPQGTFTVTSAPSDPNGAIGDVQGLDSIRVDARAAAEGCRKGRQRSSDKLTD
jgi:hypothetical protein